ncbi:MAG: Uncharacterized protein K0R99_4756 [Microbacterium sp.]|jgi:hypothetical protein|uniref:DUF4422 domain-containing protein n=1 Tax=Microbacterium sp. TaxID=51671 RepID=UPI0026258991|nr:DUF4422 domain-containing protein [Microbacterium sp.]MDF2563310.1 Uncharacterized protein [Microbacterium sp.]
MLVATHGATDIPADDFYRPIQVGRALAEQDLGFQGDDTGDSISEKNPSYCELTALYWAWRNLDADVVGLSHYRRYFTGTRSGPNGRHILSAEEARSLMSDHDVVVARPRNYYIETVASHYAHAHVAQDLTAVRRGISDASPQLIDAFDATMARRSLSLYNMFLMRHDYLDAYASWLFDVLEVAEASIDLDDRTAFQQRAFGFLGERLLNVWLWHHRHDLRIATRPVVNTYGESLPKKAVGLVRRRLARGPVS